MTSTNVRFSSPMPFTRIHAGRRVANCSGSSKDEPERNRDSEDDEHNANRKASVAPITPIVTAFAFGVSSTKAA